jgi:uncharacterized protein YegP (UPF0339 family)
MSDQTNQTPERYEDNYLACRHYNNQAPDDNRIGRFTHENGEHYFVWLSRKGDVLMRSEGYPTEAGRENGAASVVKNRDLSERYTVAEIAGRWFVTLKAGNHQEIARSCPYESEDAARNAYPVFNPNADQLEVAAAVAEEAKSAAPAREDDDYLVCSRYAGHAADENGMAKFTYDNGLHYFVWYNAAGDVLMRSESYPSTSARDNGYESVLKNRDIDKRFSVEEVNGLFFVILKAGNHQEIARSCPYRSSAEATSYYTALGAAPVADVVAPIAVTSTTTTTVTKSAEPIAVQSMQAEPIIITQTVQGEPIINTIVSTDKEDDYMTCGEYQNHAYDANGIAKFTHSNGNQYFVWYDEDGNVLLRSEGFESDEALEEELALVIQYREDEDRYSIKEKGGYKMAILKTPEGREIGRSCLERDEPTPVVVPEVVVAAPVVAAVAAVVAEPAKPADKEDDYLPCQGYRGHGGVDANGIAQFSDNGQQYFVWYDADGNVKLRSEGFSSAADLQVELDLVMKYRNDESRYTRIEKGGHHMDILKTPEGREIGRSCLEKPAPVVVAAPVVAAALVAAAVVAPEPVKPLDIEDDYLPCQDYRAHGGVDANGIAKFTHSNGQMYFVWYGADGNVLLRSEGFKSEADLQTELDLVLKYRDDKSRFNTIEKAGLRMDILKTPEGREIGRSCLEKPAPVVAAAPVAAVAAAAVAAAVVTPKADYTPPAKDREDDYLVCEDYKGKGVADGKGIVRFKHANGKKYFVWYDKAGNVLLRSEGFTANADLERELNAVLRRRNKEENYEIVERNGYRMRILKDERGREIGRSCLNKIAAAVPVAPVAAAVAAAVVAEKIVSKPEPVKVAAPVRAAVVEEAVEASSGFNWKWLLLLLPLLALLFWKGCGGCQQAATVDPVETTATVAPVATPEPVAPVATGCNCSAQTDPVFMLPASGTPAKSLTALGRAPEFGNSHGLTGAQFFDKISKKAAKDNVDKAFLDRMFKAMGYANGFADAKPEMFTEVTLVSGTVGNIGTHTNHETVYRTLDTQGKDLMAFHIKSANGCDLHFMKTCGNHFFFCPTK